jgi:deoxycytidylate deaminase
MRLLNYPYIPPNKEILFVRSDNIWMLAARKMADEYSGCCWWPTGAVLIKDDKIIGSGANAGKLQTLCPRVEHNCSTGTGYEYCTSRCEQTAHSEVNCIKDALRNNQQTTNADLYLFGHWWCCEQCWNAMIQHGIKNVFLLENADTIFTREIRLELMNELKIKNERGTAITPVDIRWKI